MSKSSGLKSSSFSPKISSNLSEGITEFVIPSSGTNIFAFSSCFSGFNGVAGVVCEWLHERWTKGRFFPFCLCRFHRWKIKNAMKIVKILTAHFN
jgi:hypothetical protein